MVFLILSIYIVFIYIKYGFFTSFFGILISGKTILFEVTSKFLPSGFNLIFFLSFSFLILILIYILKYNRIRAKKINVKKSLIYLLPWLGFYIYIIMNSNLNSYTLRKSIFFLVQGIVPIVFLFIYIIVQNKEKTKEFLNNLKYIFIFNAVIISSFVLFNAAKSGFDIYRPTPFGANPIGNAHYIAFGLISLFFLKMSIKKKLFLAFYFLINLYLMGTRSVILSLTVVLIIRFFYKMIVFIYEKKTKQQWTKKFIIIILTLCIFFGVISTNLDIFYSLYNNLLLRERSLSLFEERNVSARINFYFEALNMFLDKPVFGFGLGSFINYGSSDYPHNIILEILSELGFFGLLIYVFSLKINCIDFNCLFSNLLLFMIIFAMFSWDIGRNYNIVLFSALMYVKRYYSV
ncbi:O-antigen ligase family protein [Fuchsiella alkaliacetigena]|uniref:O-antigen ligase family protein n=1 Tax=Fuchsiella alkaliacetigena TaxID=957042 RepID=UPI00200B0629|nr:O-antigen ligase family protein [Fuchsiella alkaliacetigena]MCK8824329.1 O-antigen ligase family protein [Fuchsiella alkaliacetigena]